MLDPLADKLLLVSVFITLAVIGLVPVWLAAIAVLRDVVIGAGAFIYKWLFGPLEGRPTMPVEDQYAGAARCSSSLSSGTRPSTTFRSGWCWVSVRACS